MPLAGLRAETLEENRLYELRHGEAISQAELAGRLDVRQRAISKLEHSDDVRVSTLRQYLEALGARLELVVVFDDEDRRVPIHLGRDDAAGPAIFGRFDNQRQVVAALFEDDSVGNCDSGCSARCADRDHISGLLS